jgi:lipopolysaccharide/colanic/teichoic acid biosynthesis glycosyltransferase
VKRWFDVLLVTMSAIVWIPILLLASFGVLVFMGRPVFFIQARPGLNGKIFNLYKLRTMKLGPGTDAERLTRLGRFLRSTSLDELPSLWNVLRGDMSLVGPRPLLVQYLDRYTPEQMRRHEVRPGITGWAQVNGRQRLLFSERLKLDIDYVNQASLMFDVKILVMTLLYVFKRKDIVLGQDVLEVDDLGLYDAQS